MFEYHQPDARGHFGPYGGSFVAETLVHALDELKEAYEHYRKDPEFIAEYRSELAHFVGRPSPIYHAARMSRELGGAQIYLKREDLNHTGAHKVNTPAEPLRTRAPRPAPPSPGPRAAPRAPSTAPRRTLPRTARASSARRR